MQAGDVSDGAGPGGAGRAYAAYQARRFFGSLNGLRFLCIAAVLWHHSPAFGSIEAPLMLLRRGFTGVHFFFVLSGFLITTLLLREEGRKGRISLAGFYWRRILRIIPVYFLVVSAVGAYYVLVKGEERYLSLLPYYYLFLSNFLNGDIPLLAITWSLAVEEQYYLIWPLTLVLIASDRVRAAVLVVAIGFCVTLGAGLLAQPVVVGEVATLTFPVAGYAAILLGALTAIALHHEASFRWLYALFGHPWAAPAAFGALLVYLQLAPGDLSGLPFLGMHLLMAIGLVSIVLREDHVMRPFFAARPIARVGEISYGLYLYHLIGLHFATVIAARLPLGPDVAPWVITGLFAAISIAMAEISFRYFETAFLKLKDRRPAAQGVGSES